LRPLSDINNKRPKKAPRNRLGSSCALAFWSGAWATIPENEPAKWKDGEAQKTFELVYSLLVDQGALKEPAAIFVPLCGDGKFLQHAHSKGNTVTGCDLVPLAIDRLKRQFQSSFTEHKDALGSHEYESERVRLVCGNILKVQVREKVDLIYDKDAFGAIPIAMRSAYLDKIVEMCQHGTYVFLEVKFKLTDQEKGPPFHFSRADIETYYGERGFVLVSYNPSVYPLANFGSMNQQGFLFRYP